MRVLFLMGVSVASGLPHVVKEQSLLVSVKMVRVMDKVLSTGLMVIFMLDNLREVFTTVKAFLLVLLEFILGPLFMIVKQVLLLKPISMAMCIKENFLMVHIMVKVV